MHTFATMEVSPRTYNELSKKLESAGYTLAFNRSVDPPLIDMAGVVLQRGAVMFESSGSATIFTVKSNFGAFAVRTALLRAAFHLKKQGYGAEDVRTAEIIEQLEFKVQE